MIQVDYRLDDALADLAIVQLSEADEVRKEIKEILHILVGEEPTG